MLSYDRHNQIINILKENKTVKVKDFCKRLYSSEATIRRDLKQLEKSGQIIRVRGGAAIIESGNKDTPYHIRNNVNKEKKDMISKWALSLINDGSIIYLDSSSTVHFLANKLDKFNNLTVITNSLYNIITLSSKDNVKVISTGGLLKSQSNLSGIYCMEFLKNYHFDQAFISCSGISADYIATEANEENAYIKKLAIKNSKEKILLCDSTKFKSRFFCNIASLEEFDYVITDEIKKDYINNNINFL